MLAPQDTSSAALFRPRAIIDADGTVEGYASLFGEIDQARDMVMPGAFKTTLATRNIRRIPMLFQHDPSEPVGVWLELREDGKGLYARGRLIPDVTRGRELLALLREGAIDGLSIGFKTVKGRIDPKTRVRKLDAVDLWEISIVTFPLLAGARVHAVKSGASILAPPPVSRARAKAESDFAKLCGVTSNRASWGSPVAAPRVRPVKRTPGTRRAFAWRAPGVGPQTKREGAR
jgi:HK97 family phage prohead protease